MKTPYVRENEDGTRVCVEVDVENDVATETTFPPPGQFIRNRSLDDIDIYQDQQYKLSKLASKNEDDRVAGISIIPPIDLVANAIAAIAQNDPNIAALPEVTEVINFLNSEQ